MTDSRRRMRLGRFILVVLLAIGISAALMVGVKTLAERLFGATISYQELLVFAAISAGVITLLWLLPANRPAWFFKNLLRLVVVVVAVAAVWGAAVVWTTQQRLLYPPVKAEQRDVDALSAMAGVEKVALAGPNQEEYRGWFVKAPQKAGVILYFGGNGEDASGSVLSLRDKIAQLGLQQPFHLMVVDYPGYGLSAGQAGEESIYRMATLAWEYAVAREDVDRNHIVLLAWSLGTGTAVRLADEKEPAGMILFAPYHSGRELIANAAKHLMDWDISFVPIPVRNAYRSDRYARTTQTATLIVAAKDDEMINFAQSEQLANAFPNAKLVALASGGHGAMWRDAASIQAVTAFLQDILKK